MKAYRAIAEYYDPENAQHPMLEQDVPFFLGQLPDRRQSVLELAVGTGRAAIPVARRRGTGWWAWITRRRCSRSPAAKRDGVGLTDRELRLLRGDALRVNLDEQFDWVCVFFNTFLAFTTLEQQDRVLQVARPPQAARGRIWFDVFQPDLATLSRPLTADMEPTLFYVPEFDRTVLKTTEVRPSPASQVQQVTFNYAWFDGDGVERRERTQFPMTWIFPRQMRMLVEHATNCASNTCSATTTAARSMTIRPGSSPGVAGSERTVYPWESKTQETAMSERTVASTAPTTPDHTATPTAGSAPPNPAAARRRAAAHPGRPQRQFVSFTLYKLDPAFRRLGDHEKIQARSEFLKIFQQPRPGSHVPDLQHGRPPRRRRPAALADRRDERRVPGPRARSSTRRGSAPT